MTQYSVEVNGKVISTCDTIGKAMLVAEEAEKKNDMVFILDNEGYFYDVNTGENLELKKI